MGTAWATAALGKKNTLLVVRPVASREQASRLAEQPNTATQKIISYSYRTTHKAALPGLASGATFDKLRKHT
jgi:hypothetical protein